MNRFVKEMPNARLVWIEECGHVPHLEQPDKTARSIVDFVQNGNPAKVCSTDRGENAKNACQRFISAVETIKIRGDGRIESPPAVRLVPKRDPGVDEAPHK